VALLPYALLALVALVRVGATMQALAVVPFFVAALVVAGSAAKAVEASPKATGIPAGHPLETVAMLENHAEELETEGKKTAAAKLRDRIAKIRNKHDIVG
jgi:hypothetical protein